MSEQIRYHINPETGRANKCNAKYKCKFNLTKDEHYATAADARLAYENQQEDQGLKGAKRAEATKPTPQVKESEESPEAKVARLKEAYEAAFPAGSVPNPTNEQLKTALAYAKAIKSAVRVSSVSTHDAVKLDNEWGDEMAESNVFYTKSYLVASPKGFIVSSYLASIHGEMDDYMEYDPSVRSFHYRTSSMSEARKALATAAKKPMGDSQDLWVHPLLRRTGPNFVKPDYDHGSSSSTADASRRATDKVAGQWDGYYLYKLKESSVTPKFLEKIFSGTKNPHLRSAILMHPKLSEELQLQVAGSRDEEALRDLVKNPSLKKSTVAALLEPTNYTARQTLSTLMSNPNLPKSVMRTLASKGDIQQVRYLYNNPGMPEEYRKVIEKRTADLRVDLRGYVRQLETLETILPRG